jgi:parallel beta-helix repeat protein
VGAVQHELNNNNGGVIMSIQGFKSDSNTGMGHSSPVNTIRLLGIGLYILAMGLMQPSTVMAKSLPTNTGGKSEQALILAAAARDNKGKPTTPSILEIYDDGASGTGGDCGTRPNPIGSWDASSKTCTLIRDVNGAIRIHDPNGTEAGVTLDGNEYAVNLPADGSVTIEGSNHTLEDLTINGSSTDDSTRAGVYLSHAYFVTVTDIEVTNTVVGITFFSSMNSSVNDSTFSGVRTGANLNGTYHQYFCEEENYLTYCGASNNTLVNNTFSHDSTDHDGYGIYLGHAARDNTIRGNTISSFNYGVYIPDWYCSYIYTSYSSCQDGNKVYQNSFIDNFIDDYTTSFKTQIYADWGYTTTVFNLDAPDGGNYFNDFDEPAEGCEDANGDGFCDICYYGKNTYDCLPWTTEEGWSHEDSEEED